MGSRLPCRTALLELPAAGPHALHSPSSHTAVTTRKMLAEAAARTIGQRAEDMVIAAVVTG